MTYPESQVASSGNRQLADPQSDGVRILSTGERVVNDCGGPRTDVKSTGSSAHADVGDAGRLPCSADHIDEGDADLPL